MAWRRLSPNSTRSGFIKPGLRPGPTELYGARDHSASGELQAPIASAFDTISGHLDPNRWQWLALAGVANRHVARVSPLESKLSSTAVQACTSSSSTGKSGPRLRLTRS